MYHYISTKVCKASDIGVNNNLFGGTMISWLDEAAASLASSLCCSPNLITLKIDSVLFKKAVHVRDHIRIYGKLTSIGRSSVSLEVEARRFNFCEASEELVCSTNMTFVNVDANGKSFPINGQLRSRLQKEIDQNISL